MPKYAKRSRKHSKRRSRSRRKTKTTWQVAKKAARAVLKSQAAPLYVRKIYGNYNDATGQFTDQEQVGPGPVAGYIDNAPVQIAIPAATSLFGFPGYRKDLEVTITGIKLSLRFQLPQNFAKAKVVAYLYLDKQHAERVAGNDPLLATQFKAPDEFFMLRDEEDLRSDMHNIKILAKRTLTMTSLPSSGGNNFNRVFRDMNIWWKPKKGGLKYKYTDAGADSLLNRGLGICVKASYPENPAGDTVSFGGVMNCYYRDYA